MKDFVKYLKAVDCYNEEQEVFCRQLLAGINLGLKHHNLNCISFTDAFPSLIGMKNEDFFLLLVRLQIPLQRAFPASPIAFESSPSRATNTCELRFKVFIVLYRLRHAISFKFLEGQFGWSSSAIHEGWTRILRVFHQHLHSFHRGFLAFRGHQWQLQEIANWKAYHEELVGDYQAFLDRIEVQNNGNHLLQ